MEGLTALKARNNVGSSLMLVFFVRQFLFRAFSASKKSWAITWGGCPRLLHFAPLALKAGVLIRLYRRWFLTRLHNQRKELCN